MTAPDGSLFEPAGQRRWVPTELARGPWDPRACHGGPVSALLARAVERIDDDAEIDWHVARLTVELTRPVPVGRPLGLSTEIERPGRRVSLVAAVLTDDGTEVARVRALRIRRQEIALPDDTVRAADDRPGPPESGRIQPTVWADDGRVAFHRDACEHRFVEGDWGLGPATVWITLLVPVVPGEEPSGVQRVAAAADFGNGISAGLPQEFLFINPDLTIHLQRPPSGRWVGLGATSHYGTADPSLVSCGTGMAESALYDVSGRVGRSVQSLLVAPR